MDIICRPQEVVAVINELHDVAEIVRTYGDLGDMGNGHSMSVGMPMQLYLTAAAIEAQLRSIAHGDQLCAARLFRSDDDPARSVMNFDLTVADTVTVGAVSTEVCIAELTEAHRRLAAAAKQLRTALQAKAMATVNESLDNEVARLRTFVAAFA